MHLTEQETIDLRCFLNFLMFENQGAFVIFGSKPLCEISLGNPDSKAAEDAFHKWLASLSDDERARIENVKKKIVERQSSDTGQELRSSHYRGWVVLKKVFKSLEIKNYVLRAVPLRCPDTYDILLINVPTMTALLSKHYKVFKKATGMAFEPRKIVWEAQDPDSPFWKRVFSMENHLAKGLLFGFGLTNSLEKNILHAASTDPVKYGEGSLTNFRIPLFGAIPGDATRKKYEKEKRLIEEIYKGKDVIEVTISRLSN